MELRRLVFKKQVPKLHDWLLNYNDGKYASLLYEGNSIHALPRHVLDQFNSDKYFENM